MAQPATDDAYIAQRLDTVLSHAWDEECYAALAELFQFLSQHPRRVVLRSPSVQCAVAVDSFVECILEILPTSLSPELRSHTTFAVYDGLPAVIRMLQKTAPTVLAIQTNLLLHSSELGMAACVAASPGTRYLVMTSSEKWAEEFRKLPASLHVSVEVLLMPFDLKEFATALGRLARTGS